MITVVSFEKGHFIFLFTSYQVFPCYGDGSIVILWTKVHNAHCRPGFTVCTADQIQKDIVLLIYYIITVGT